MEVKYEKKEPIQKPVGKISPGEAFMFGDVPYIRVSGYPGSPEALNTYGMIVENGWLKKFDCSTEVTPVEASVTIKYDMEENWRDE